MIRTSTSAARASKDIPRTPSTTYSKPIMLDQHKEKLDLSDARQHLESSEELFRVSLIAKNDEITQLGDEVKANKHELDEENKLVAKLKEQLQNAKELSVKKDEEIASIEKQNHEINVRITEATTKLKDLVFNNTVRDYHTFNHSAAEHVAQLQEKVDELKNEIIVQNGLVTLLRKGLFNLDGKKNVSESESDRIRQRVSALEEELQRKDIELGISHEKEKLLRNELKAKEEAIGKYNK